MKITDRQVSIYMWTMIGALLFSSLAYIFAALKGTP